MLGSRVMLSPNGGSRDVKNRRIAGLLKLHGLVGLRDDDIIEENGDAPLEWGKSDGMIRAGDFQ